MSAEKLTEDLQKNFIHTNNFRANEKKLTVRVDINHLLARVREDKKKENKINLIFFGLFTVVISVIGIVLSF